MIEVGMERPKLTKQQEAKLMRVWMARPEKFFADVLGWEPWEKQIEILHSIRDNRETFVQSCNAAGKSWLAAGIVLWWTITRFNGKVITTAPTWRQVKDVLWAKIMLSVSTVLLGISSAKRTTKSGL